MALRGRAAGAAFGRWSPWAISAKGYDSRAARMRLRQVGDVAPGVVTQRKELWTRGRRGHVGPGTATPIAVASTSMEALDLATPVIHPTAFVAPGTHVFGEVAIGENAVVMFGTVIRAEFDAITVGARTNIQDNSVLHADAGSPCIIGDDVTVGHAAVLHGATIRSHCLIGIGSRVLNRSVIGEGAWLAAGSLLPEGQEIPPWTLAMGAPAKPVRELTDDEISRQRDGVVHYQQFAATYRRLFA